MLFHLDLLCVLVRTSRACGNVHVLLTPVPSASLLSRMRYLLCACATESEADMRSMCAMCGGAHVLLCCVAVSVRVLFQMGGRGLCGVRIVRGRINNAVNVRYNG